MTLHSQPNINSHVNFDTTRILSGQRDGSAHSSSIASIGPSAVRDSSVHMDSPIIYEKVDRSKKSRLQSSVCTITRPALS